MSLPEWVIPFKESPREIKCIGGKYYKYEVCYRYDPEKKRTIDLFPKTTSAANFGVIVNIEKRMFHICLLFNIDNILQILRRSVFGNRSNKEDTGSTGKNNREGWIHSPPGRTNLEKN
ncbi:hypothetical protein FACS1894152_3880 [Bacilli bacterium]|nr:hypothetical protein FACS1894152_3880 [Bacilli bacterium]